MNYTLYSSKAFKWNMCLGLVNLQSFRKPSVLLLCQLAYLAAISWPLVIGLFQPFVEQDETISIPEESLNTVAPAAAEKEKRIRKRVQLKLLLYHISQAVYTSAQVCIAAGNKNAVGLKLVQHDFRLRRKVARNSAEVLA